MKKFRKYILFFTALLTIIGLIGFHSKSVKADNNDTTLTLGTSLTSSQKQETTSVLTQGLNGSSYNTITVDGSDLVKYLNPSGDNFTDSSGVWSSALVQKTAVGSGINVKILPYNGQNNITTITADQYKNAALTAGIKDCNIYVTSAVPIDGSGALAGVYKALSDQGTKLNQNQINAAQNEMGTLSGINKQNKGKKGYSDAQLNNAVAGAKKQMAQQGQNISDSQIGQIVNNQININHLGNTINNNQKQQIIKLLEQVRDSGALKNGNFEQQASKLSGNIQNNAKNIFNNLNTNQNRNFLQQIIDSLINFFKNTF